MLDKPAAVEGTSSEPRGYRHELYVRSLAEFGDPLHLPGCGGWLLERSVPGAPAARDAMGPYPLFQCADFSKLPDDLDRLGGRLLSVSMVADPFGNFAPAELQARFDQVTPFKTHFLVELEKGVDESRFPKHHRYYARRALRELGVERAGSPSAHLDEWSALYAKLVARHDLRGVKAFSRRAFETQMQVPGFVMLRAVREGRALAAHLWYVDGRIAYSHLMAVDEEGYARSASYALYHQAIVRAAELFGPEVRVLNLGGGAGLGLNADDGLSRFKRGWATGTVPVYFCGRVLDRAGYDRIARDHPAPVSYFPAYRAGELA